MNETTSRVSWKLMNRNVSVKQLYPHSFSDENGCMNNVHDVAGRFNLRVFCVILKLVEEIGGNDQRP